MANQNDFKYVIQTELKLSAGSLNALLEQVKGLDKSIKSQNIGTVSLNARISRQSISEIQREIKNLKTDMFITAKLDKNSVAGFKRQLAILVDSARKDLSSLGATTVPATNTPIRSVQNAINASSPNRVRLGTQTSAMSEDDIRNTNRLALADQRAAKAADLRATSALKSARALGMQSSEEAKALRIEAQRIRINEAMSRVDLNRQKVLDSKSQIIDRESRMNSREKRLGATTASPNAPVISSSMKILEEKLLDNAIPMKQKIVMMNQLTSEYRKLAKASGQNINKSFLFTDEFGAKIRTTTKEFTNLGKVFDRGDKSVRTMALQMARSSVIYSTMAAGFAAVTASVFGTVNAMAQFESQFLKIQNITSQRNEDAIADGLASPYSKSGKESKADIFGLGKKYGLNPTGDIMPIYTDIIRRADISKNATDAKRLTQLVVRAGLATGGNDIQGDDLQRLGQDFTSIYAQMFDVWAPNGNGEVAIRKMSDFVDVLAKMSSSGANIDKSMDAISDLVPYVTGDGKMDLNLLSAIVSTAQHTMSDSSGSEISSVLKMMFTNLVKADGDGSKEARRILGTGVDNSLQEQLNALIVRMNPESDNALTKGEIGELSRNLAASGGANGGARNAQFSKILKSLPDAYELYQSSLNSQGKAEEMAIRFSQTLRGEWQKLIATMQELAVNLGESGVGSALKSIVKSLNAVAGAISTLLALSSKLGNVLPSVFGEKMGGGMNDFVSNVLVAGTAIAGGKFAYNKLVKKQGAGAGAGAGGNIVLTAAQSALMFGTPMPTGKIVPAPAGEMARGKSTRIVRGADGLFAGLPNYSAAAAVPVVPKPVVVPPVQARRGVGGAVTNALNAAWLFTSFRKGPDVTGKAAQTAGSALTKFGTTIMSLGGPLLRFLSLLTRLSIIGAVLGGVFMAGKFLYDKIEEGKNKKATALSNAFSTQKGSDETFAQLDRMRELIDKGNPNTDRYSTISYRRERQKDLRDAGIFGSSIAEGDMLADGKEFIALENALKEKGMKLKYRSGGDSKTGVLDYALTDYVTGKRDNYKFDLFDKDGKNQLKLQSEALINNTGLLSLKWEDANKGALNYANTISTITGIQDRLSQISEVQNISSALNSAKFLGAEDSTSYISGEMSYVQRTMKTMDADYRELTKQQNLIQENANKNLVNLKDSSAKLMDLDTGGKKISAIDEAFNSAKEAGSVDTFANQYESMKVTPEGEAQYNYARALVNTYREAEALDKSKKSINDMTNSIAQQITALKQLQVSYIVASSGVNVFEGALKGVKSQVAAAQSAFNMAEGYDNQKKAMSGLFTSMAGEARLYQEEVASIQKTINEVMNSAPDQDFSTAALYGPDDSGLTKEQLSVRNLNESLFESKANESASMEALYQQIGAMKELVLNSDKYKTMWESVNERITLSQDLVKELNSLASDRAMSGTMSELSQAVTGKNKNEFLQEASTSRRDSYLDITQEIKKSFVTYGKDAEKLKEALSEIKGSYTDKIKTAFLEPLNQIITGDMKSAAETLKESSETYQSTVDLLNQILQTALEGINVAVEKITGTKESIFQAPTNESDTQAQSYVVQGLNKLNQAWNSQNEGGLLGKGKAGLSGLGDIVKGVAVAYQAYQSKGQIDNIPEQYRQYAQSQINKDRIQVYNGNTGSAGVTWGVLANKKITDQTNVTAEQLNAFISDNLKKNGTKDSMMAGQGESFIQAANQTGLDPIFLMALAAQESGWGKQGTIGADKNAIYSIGAVDSNPRGGAWQYDTVEKGIIEGAKFIAEKYANVGQDTIMKMRSNGGVHEYNSNDSWVKGVSQIMSQFGSNSISGNESGIATTGTMTNGLSSLLNEASRLSKNKTFTYQQVGGEFKGSYQEFVNRALSDCSQFVQEMFQNFLGINLPRTAAEQFKQGEAVDRNELQAGDLLFFNTTGKTASHVGISTGGTKFMQMGTQGLNEGDLNDSTWSKVKFDGARRIKGVGSAGLPFGMGELTESLKLEQALNDMLSEAKVAIEQSFREQATNLMSQKDIIKNNNTVGLETFTSNMGVNGQGKFALSSYSVDASRESFAQVMSAIKANQDFLKNAPTVLSRLMSDSKDMSKSQEERSLASAQYESLNNLLNDGKFVKEIQNNTKNLQVLADRYAAEAAKDPTRNATVAADKISNQQQLIAEINRKGRTGSVQYYDALTDSNQMYGSYLTTEKKTGIVQEHFDNTGNEYGQLAKLKQVGFGENVSLIFKQMTAVSKVLAGLTSGTNAWHLAIEDAVELQEKIIELENKKTETAKRYFELTSQGVYAYVNSRAFTQNRDVRRASDNQQVMTDKYNNAYRNNPNASYTEGLVSLQAISEAYEKVQSQIEDYRNGVVGAFKAGVLSLNEYIKKMTELRDVQQESRQQALEMKSSIESTFQSSLSGALKSGFEGGFDAQGDFLKNMKSGISGTIADQMSTAVLTQSGLMDSVNGIIGKLVGSMTTGNPNDAVNLFNNMDIGKLLDTELSKFLPLIQQITDSTNGIFNIMKDEVFNAPDGFKVDSALYEMQKPLTYEDVMSKFPDRNTNEAGAPNTLPNSKPSDNIVLPPTTSPIGGGVGNIIGEIVKPIESVGNGSTNTPLNTKIVNPVEALIQGIIQMKDLYNDDGKGAGGAANQLLNSEADKLREQLKVLAPEIAAKIGDGKTGMSLEKMTQYLATQDLSAYEMSLGIDGLNGGIGALTSLTGAKLDSMIGGISGVISAVNTMRGNESSGLITTPTGGTGGTVIGIPPSGISTTPVANAGTGNNGVGSSQDIKDNIAKVQSDAAFREAERIRTQQVIANRKAAGLDTSAQEKYLSTLGKYHTGGIAGMMNFANANSLKANEIHAILQTGEPVLQGGQISSLASHFLNNGASSGNNSTLDVNINIVGNTSGMDDETLKEAIANGISQGIAQQNRQSRLNNLGGRGVSYS